VPTFLTKDRTVANTNVFLYLHCKIQETLCLCAVSQIFT